MAYPLHHITLHRTTPHCHNTWHTHCTVSHCTTLHDCTTAPHSTAPHHTVPWHRATTLNHNTLYHTTLIRCVHDTTTSLSQTVSLKVQPREVMKNYGSYMFKLHVQLAPLTHVQDRILAFVPAQVCCTLTCRCCVFQVWAACCSSLTLASTSRR